MGHPFKFTDDQIKAAIPGSYGIMGNVLKRLNMGVDDDANQITRQGLHERFKNSAELKQLLEDERAKIDDMGEDAFQQALYGKEDWAVKEWLKYRGRPRGYIATSDVAIEGTINIIPQRRVEEPRQLEGIKIEENHALPDSTVKHTESDSDSGDDDD